MTIRTLNALTSAKLLSTTALTAASLALAMPQDALADNWDDLDTLGGEINTDTSQPDTTNIDLLTDRAYVAGDLDINEGWTVNVSDGHLVAKDTENDPTYILGNLNCAGTCTILDADGTFFGSGSIVNAGSVIASTGELMNPDQFLAGGDMELGNFSDAPIVIQGGATINVSEAGLAAFLSPFVTNNGVINARMATVAMAAGETVTIDLYGDGLVEVAVEGELEDALLENNGVINAEGGLVQMTALAAKNAVDNVINMNGIITVASAEVQGGRIILSGGSKGTVNVNGTLDASGTDGGHIDITGENVHVTADSEIRIDSTGDHGNGGTAYIYGDQYAIFEGEITARGGALSGDGGFVEISATEAVGYNGFVDTTAANGTTGTLLIDPRHIVINDTWSFLGFQFGPNGSITIYDQALANTLRSTNVNLWATETISTGSNIDLSTWAQITSCGFLCFETIYGITDNNLTIAAPTINLLHDIVLGTGGLNIYDLGPDDSVFGFGFFNPPYTIEVDVVNLDGTIYSRSEVDGELSVADSSQLDGEAHTINVLSNNALINQGIQFASNGAVVNVGAGTYNESVIIDRSIELRGNNAGTSGMDDREEETIITGGSPAFVVNVNNVTIDGFTMDGPGLTYGVLLNDVRGTQILNNIISNSSIAGIGGVIDHHPGSGTTLIEGNFIDGSNTGDGIALAGDSAGKDDTQSILGTQIDIRNNQIGEEGDRIGGRGVVFTKIGDLGDSIEDAGTTNVTATINISGNDVYSTDNAVEFGGSVADATINITENNNFDSLASGIVFAGVVSDSVINIANNVIHAAGVGINFLDDLQDGATINLTDNTIGTLGNEVGSGIVFDHIRSAIVNIVGGFINTGNGSGSAGGDGIHFARGLSSGADVNISGVTVDAADEAIDVNGTLREGASFTVDGGSYTGGRNGIEFAAIRGSAEIKNATVIGNGNNKRGVNLLGDISGSLTITNNTITGGDDAIGSNNNQGNTVTGGTVLISGNTLTGINGDGIEFGAVSDGADIDIINNESITGGDNGIHFTGGVNGSSVNISSNYGRIFADDHGIYFAGDISGGADIDIHDNVIAANEDGGSTGDGILFGGDIYAATINIGDGLGGSFFADPSNVISGVNGIRFAGDLHDGTSIEIDGNRIGYSVTSGGYVYGDEVSDDGIDFDGDISGDASVTITDNYINADDDGIEFDGNIGGSASILIGGLYDGNTIFADDDGIEFEGDITDQASIEISYNDIEADENGVQFNGDTSNHNDDYNDPEEILIAYNSIVGGEHGIVFYGEASGPRHDIMIRDNYLIKGEGENGISHFGNINGAELTIEDNDKIDGQKDGIKITGYFYNDAGIRIHGNHDIRGRTDDGIHIQDYGFDRGVDLEIDHNHIHWSSDDGIYVRNVQDASIHHNDIHNVGGNGINGSNVDFASIYQNDIWNVDEHGIKIGNGSNNVDLAYNTIYGAGWDGIRINGGNNATIRFNDIFNVGDDGIDVNNNNFVNIVGNYIWGTGLSPWLDGVRGGNGIELSGSSFASIRNNDIWFTGGDGIDATFNPFLSIYNNIVNFAGDDGIDVENSFAALIAGNAVFGAQNNGIELDFSNFATIIGNLVLGAGDNGFFVNASDNVDIAYNIALFNGGDGIEVNGGEDINISNNIVALNGDDGIDVNDAQDVNISNNIVVLNADDGINVDGGEDITISDNFVALNGDDGVDVDGAEDVDISGNSIFLNGDDGIDIDGGEDITISDNNIALNADDGISLNGADDVDISDNDITQNGDDGIDVDGGANITISNNDIASNGDDGVDVNGAYNVNILDNFIFANFDDGIFINADYRGKEGRNIINIVGNEVTDNGDDGVEVVASSRGSGVDLTVESNHIHNNADNGILLVARNGRASFQGDALSAFADLFDFEFNSSIIDNLIENNGTHGLNVQGSGHGDVVLAGNTFIDNQVGARFESGNIDLTNLENPNSFIFTEDFDPDGPVIGLQFELANPEDPTSLTIVDETLGGTIFEGFIDRPVDEAYYVRFEDGAMLDEEGAVITIDGTQASWDGVVPVDFGNILPESVLDAIEARIWDADDPTADGRGQIFVADVPVVDNFTIENIEDFFNQFDEFGGDTTGLNVTITGLPSVGGLSGVGATGPAPGTAEFLANIAPAAGNADEGEGNEQGSEELAEIEPAAGGEAGEGPCLGDVVNAASAGQTTTLSWGGSFEDSLASVSACQSGTL